MVILQHTLVKIVILIVKHVVDLILINVVLVKVGIIFIYLIANVIKIVLWDFLKKIILIMDLMNVFSALEDAVNALTLLLIYVYRVYLIIICKLSLLCKDAKAIVMLIQIFGLMILLLPVYNVILHV